MTTVEISQLTPGQRVTIDRSVIATFVREIAGGAGAIVELGGTNLVVSPDVLTVEE